MEINLNIDDDKVKYFSPEAKNELASQTQKFALEIVKEAEKVDNMFRESGASPEITSNTIFQAVRRNKTSSRKKLPIILLKILSEILLFVSGLMFNQELFANTLYFATFSIVFLLAIILTITMNFKDGE